MSAEADLLGSDFYLGQLSLVPPCLLGKHTSTHKNAVVMPACVQEQLQERYCNCTPSDWWRLCSHTEEGLGLDYLKAPSQLRYLN